MSDRLLPYLLYFTDTCFVQQLHEELADLGSDLRSVSSDLAALSLAEDFNVMRMEKDICYCMYNCSVKIWKLLSTLTVTVPSSVTSLAGVKLPKIDIPRFDGNILGWRTFWEEFKVSIHNHTSLSKTEKSAYLHSSLKVDQQGLLWRALPSPVISMMRRWRV